jgi:hypothetical protein
MSLMQGLNSSAGFQIFAVVLMFISFLVLKSTLEYLGFQENFCLFVLP